MTPGERMAAFCAAMAEIGVKVDVSVTAGSDRLAFTFSPQVDTPTMVKAMRIAGLDALADLFDDVFPPGESP